MRSKRRWWKLRKVLWVLLDRVQRQERVLLAQEREIFLVRSRWLNQVEKGVKALMLMLPIISLKSREGLGRRNYTRGWEHWDKRDSKDAVVGNKTVRHCRGARSSMHGLHIIGNLGSGVIPYVCVLKQFWIYIAIALCYFAFDLYPL
jgi:hypothetical protein